MPRAICACCWPSIRLHPDLCFPKVLGYRAAHAASTVTAADVPMSRDELPLFRDAFVASAARRAQVTALVCGSQRLSYAQLARRAQCIAAALHAASVKPGDRVLLYLDNSIEFVEALYAVMHIG